MKKLAYVLVLGLLAAVPGCYKSTGKDVKSSKKALKNNAGKKIVKNNTYKVTVVNQTGQNLRSVYINVVFGRNKILCGGRKSRKTCTGLANGQSWTQNVRKCVRSVSVDYGTKRGKWAKGKICGTRDGQKWKMKKHRCRDMVVTVTKDTAGEFKFDFN